MLYTAHTNRPLDVRPRRAMLTAVPRPAVEAIEQEAAAEEEAAADAGETVRLPCISNRCRKLFSKVSRNFCESDSMCADGPQAGKAAKTAGKRRDERVGGKVPAPHGRASVNTMRLEISALLFLSLTGKI